MKPADATVVVRLRADGIPQIVRRRAHRLPPVEPWIPTLALGFIALALYVGALAPAAVIVLLAAACTALDAVRSARPPQRAAPQAGPRADVLPMRASATHR